MTTVNIARDTYGLWGSVRLGACIAGLMLATACSEETSDRQEQREPLPARVSVVQVQPETVTFERIYPASARSAEEAQVRARVEGVVIERSYEEGGSVEAGAVLFRIDPAPFEARVQQAEAELQRRQARLRQAQRSWRRATELFEKHAISEADRDEILSGLELAQADVANAEAALRDVRIELGYTQVEAPIDGVTGLRMVSEGNLVEPGALLTTVRQLDPIHVLFSVPEADARTQRSQMDLAAAAPGAEGRLSAEVRFSDGSVYDQTGFIDYLGANVDPQTGTVQARAVMPNPHGDLLPGQFVRVSVGGIESKGAIAVPPEAVAEGTEGPIVYVVSAQHTAQARPVQLGPVAKEGQVIVQGLAGGERVIVSGIAGLRPDQPVRIENATAARSATGTTEPS